MALVAGSNSYGTRAEADAYFNDSLRKATWAAVASATKDQGLIEATRVFERQAWAGEKEVPSQDLAFGRTGLTDKDGVALTPAETLEVAKEAQFEYALFLITDPTQLGTREATGSNIKKLEAGSAKVTYFTRVNGTRFPLTVTDLIGDWFGGNSGSNIGGSVSGNCDSSSFTTPDEDYGKTKGYY
jgi:hypothetical protein